MADDDDWDTDPDFKNDLTEAEKRAYGNRETMEKYQAATGGHGAAVGSESGALDKPAAAAPKMGEVINDAEPVGLTPAPRAEYTPAPAANAQLQQPVTRMAEPQMPAMPSVFKDGASRRGPAPVTPVALAVAPASAPAAAPAGAQARARALAQRSPRPCRSTSPQGAAGAEVAPTFARHTPSRPHRRARLRPHLPPPSPPMAYTRARAAHMCARVGSLADGAPRRWERLRSLEGGHRAGAHIYMYRAGHRAGGACAHCMCARRTGAPTRTHTHI